jgi:hypothetical protein
MRIASRKWSVPSWCEPAHPNAWPNDPTDQGLFGLSFTAIRASAMGACHCPDNCKAKESIACAMKSWSSRDTARFASCSALETSSQSRLPYSQTSK